MVTTINNIAIGNLFHLKKAAFYGWDERPQDNTLWSVANIANGKIEVNNNGLMPIDVKHLKPIPLTVQRLKDFGFVQMRDTSIFTLRSAATLNLKLVAILSKASNSFTNSKMYINSWQMSPSN